MADESADLEGGGSGGGGGDDGCGWVCTLCTYHNAAEKFKCEICDLRRGTSTRKPRCSTDTIVAQVMKQQEQIRQQTRAKPSPKSKAGTSVPGSGASSNDPSRASKKSSNSRTSSSSTGHHSSSKKAQRPRNNDEDLSSDSSESSSESSSDSDDSRDSADKDREPSRGNARSPALKRKQTAVSWNHPSTRGIRPNISAKASNDHPKHDSDDGEDSDEDEDDLDSDSTSVASDTPAGARSSRVHKPPSESSIDDQSPYSSSSAMTPEPTTSSPNHSASLSGKQLQDNPLKNRPIEVNGTMVRGNPPPTLSGRSGLIVDKKRFTQQSVTLEDTTITFTEFATRENKYVRKKKKRSRTRTAPAPASGAVADAD